MYLVFDVGATHTRIAVAHKGKLGPVHRFDTHELREGYEEFVRRLRSVCGDTKLTAIAGDVPGSFDATGKLVQARNLSSWVGINPKKDLAERFNCPVTIVNDAVLCAIGESHYGAGSPKGEMAYVTVSTGVNGVRILNGRPDQTIPEYNLGWQIVSGGPKQAAGLEDLIGGGAIEQRMGIRPSQIHDEKFWHQTAGYLARALFNMRLYWNPSVIVLGGRMMKDIPLEALHRQFEDLPDVFREPLRVRRSALGDDAGLWGALSYLENQP